MQENQDHFSHGIARKYTDENSVRGGEICDQPLVDAFRGEAAA
jgi:hypothetical protein